MTVRSMVRDRRRPPRLAVSERGDQAGPVVVVVDRRVMVGVEQLVAVLSISTTALVTASPGRGGPDLSRATWSDSTPGALGFTAAPTRLTATR